jgi:hypothetical protein
MAWYPRRAAPRSPSSPATFRLRPADPPRRRGRPPTLRSHLAQVSTASPRYRWLITTAPPGLPFGRPVLRRRGFTLPHRHRRRRHLTTVTLHGLDLPAATRSSAPHRSASANAPSASCAAPPHRAHPRPGRDLTFRVHIASLATSIPPPLLAVAPATTPSGRPRLARSLPPRSPSGPESPPTGSPGHAPFSRFARTPAVLSRLAAEMSREWFHAHKGEYESKGSSP